MKTRLSLLVFVVCVVAGSATAASAPGAGFHLDRGFSGNGKEVLTPGSYAEASGIAEGLGNRVLVSGIALGEGDRFAPALAQVKRSGAVDESFGDHGEVVLDQLQTDRNAFPVFQSSIDYDKRDRIVVAGTIEHGSGDIYVLRLLRNGDPDTSFDDDGYEVIDLADHGSRGGDDRVALVEASQGAAITIAGGTSKGRDGSLFTLRLTGDGGLDHDYGAGGVRYVDFPGRSRRLRDAAATRDGGGMIVAAGDAEGVHVARVGPDGDLDRSFGKRGRVSIDLPRALHGRAELASAVRTAKGSLVFGGAFEDRAKPAGNDPHAGHPYDGLLVRLRGSGALNRAFGKGGFAILDRKRYDEISSIATTPSGGILAVGRSSEFDANYRAGWFAASYSIGGKLIKGGYSKLPLQSSVVGPFMTVGSNGKPLLTGTVVNDYDEGTGFQLARLTKK